MAEKETLSRPKEAMRPNDGKLTRLYAWCQLKREKDPVKRAKAAAVIARGSSRFRKIKTIPHEVAVRVRCHGRLHRITSMLAGRFTIMDHTRQEQGAFETLVKLGAEAPRCMTLQKKFDADGWNTEGVPAELIPHWTLRAVVRNRRLNANPKVEELGLRGRLVARKLDAERLMRELQWHDLLRNSYPNVRKTVIGFASDGIPVGVDLRHILAVSPSNSSVMLAGTELVAVLPRTWPDIWKEGLGLIQGKLVVSARKNSTTLATVQVAIFSQQAQIIRIETRTARMLPGKNYAGADHPEREWEFI